MSDLVADLLAGIAAPSQVTADRDPNLGRTERYLRPPSATGTADVIGVTGSPGAGKSTLVDKVAATYREQGQTVGVIALTHPRRSPAARCSATGYAWPRTLATWTCSSGR